MVCGAFRKFPDTQSPVPWQHNLWRPAVESSLQTPQETTAPRPRGNPDEMFAHESKTLCF